MTSPWPPNHPPHPRAGRFLTFEGSDGSGKSTQLERTQQWLEAQGRPVLVTKEPGGTVIGQQIREVLLHPDHQALCEVSELLLYLSDRVQHLQEKILPALQAGTWVLCDRFHDSTVAYQGYGRGLDLSALDSVVAHHIAPHVPDRTFWLDLSPQQSLQRLQQRGRTPDRLDQESLAFFERVRRGYQALAQSQPHRLVPLDAEASIEDLHQQIISQLSAF